MPCKSAAQHRVYSLRYVLVERILTLHKNLASAKTPHRESVGKESVQRQVESTDGMIDKLVYELYGVSEEEIEVAEYDYD